MINLIPPGCGIRILMRYAFLCCRPPTLMAGFNKTRKPTNHPVDRSVGRRRVDQLIQSPFPRTKLNPTVDVCAQPPIIIFFVYFPDRRPRHCSKFYFDDKFESYGNDVWFRPPLMHVSEGNFMLTSEFGCC